MHTAPCWRDVVKTNTTTHEELPPISKKKIHMEEVHRLVGATVALILPLRLANTRLFAIGLAGVCVIHAHPH